MKFHLFPNMSSLRTARLRSNLYPYSKYMEKMDNSTETKFRNIITEFLIKTTEVNELVLKEGSKVGMQKMWEWSNVDLDWELSDDDIRDFQITLIGEKNDDVDIIEKIHESFNVKGHYNYSYMFDGHPFRINWSRGSWKDYMRIRKLPKKVSTPSELGIPQLVRDVIRTYRWGGLFLFTAPPGNGKSTSISSLVQEIADERCLNIITLEDPMEYVYSSNSKSIIQQREVWFDMDSYETGIEACMRQTPDIVVVQEMTTQKIIREVMLLLSKGCMVISTLHTPDTNSTFDSILDAFEVSERPAIQVYLKSFFKCFVAQKLIPRKDKKGRVAVFEILTNTPEVKWFITDNNTKNIHQVLEKPGHLSFQKDLINRIEAGEISLDVALEYCPESRLRAFKGILWV